MSKIKIAEAMRDEYYLILMKKYNTNDSEMVIDLISTEENSKREHLELMAMGLVL